MAKKGLDAYNKKKVNYDVVFTFVNSVSDDDKSNDLFGDIARYIREDEE